MAVAQRERQVLVWGDLLLGEAQVIGEMKGAKAGLPGWDEAAPLGSSRLRKVANISGQESSFTICRNLREIKAQELRPKKIPLGGNRKGLRPLGNLLESMGCSGVT